MFNELLTGKATLDPPPMAADPYRVESVPEVSVMCVSCLKDFKTKVHNSSAMRCPSCHVAFVEANQVESARALASAEARFERSRRDTRLWLFAVGAVISLALGFIRYQMKKDLRESAGSQSSDVYIGSYTGEYSYALYNFSGDACRCADLKCGREVQVRVDQFLKRSPGPTDDNDSKLGTASLQNLADCLGKLE